MPRKSNPIRWTVDRASKEFGVANQTLDKKLARAGTKPGEDGCYSTKQIDSAIHDDISEERKRLTKEQADKTALQNAITRGETVSLQGVYKAYEGVFIALRQTILATNMTDAEKAECLNNLRHDLTEAKPFE